MPTIEDLQISLEAIQTALATRPDFGSWGTPVDNSVIIRIDEAGSQMFVEDLPILANTMLGRSGSGDIHAMNSEGVRNLIASDETNVGWVLKIDGSGTSAWGTPGILEGTLDVALTGTITSSNASTAISGSETLFLTQLNVGDAIKITSASVSEIHSVASITSNTILDLDSNWTGGTWTGSLGYSDSDLFTIKDGDNKTQLIVDKSGNTTVAGNISASKIYVGAAIQPSRNGVAYLGTSGKRWTNIHTSKATVYGDISATGNITASGDISASGDIYASGNLYVNGGFTGIIAMGDNVAGTLDGIAVQGDISASGDFYSGTAGMKLVKSMVNASVNEIPIFTDNNTVQGHSGLTYTSGDGLFVGNDITADGDISASGDLTTGGALDVALTGYITASNASTHISGSGTFFTTELNVGDAIKIVSSSVSQIFTVSSISSQTSMSIDSDWTGNTWTGSFGYKDSDLFTIKDGDNKTQLTVDKSGNAQITGSLIISGTSAGVKDATLTLIPRGLAGHGLKITGSTINGIPLMELGQDTTGEFIYGKGESGKDSFRIRQGLGSSATLEMYMSHSHGNNIVQHRFLDPTQGDTSYVNYTHYSTSNAPSTDPTGNDLSGKFGINTNNPQKALHVCGSILATGNAEFLNPNDNTERAFSITENNLTGSGNLEMKGNISASLSSTGSFGHLMVGGGNFSSASLAAGGGGGSFSFPTTQTISSSAELVIEKSGSFGDNLTVAGDISASGYLYTEGGAAISGSLNVGMGSSSPTIILRNIVGTAGWRLATKGTIHSYFDPQQNASITHFGIKTTNPTKALTVSGSISASGDFYSPNFSTIGGNITASGNIILGSRMILTDSLTEFTSSFEISSTVTSIKLKPSADHDFSIDTHEMDNNFYIDSTDGNVGIKTSTPTKTLTVAGDISASGDLLLQGGITASTDIYALGNIIGDDFTDITNIRAIYLDTIQGDGANNVQIGMGIGGISFQAEAGDRFSFNEGEKNVDLIYNNSDDATFVYFDASTSRVGIGDDISQTPSKTLTVAGDISASGGQWLEGNLALGSSTVSHSVDGLTVSGDIRASGELTVGTIMGAGQYNYTTFDNNIMMDDGAIFFHTDQGTKIRGNTNSITIDGDNDIGIYADNDTNFVEGNVGIGTGPLGFNNPQKLTVEGDISASGGISIGNVGAQKGRFSVNYGTGGTMTGSLTSAGDGYGEIVQLGGTDTVGGTIYFLQTDGEWKHTDARHVDSGSSQLLGIALGTNSSGSGMLLKGVVKYFKADYLTTGNKVYIQNGIGLITGSFPTDTGNFARVIGYALSGSNRDNSTDIIYFNPDNTWIEVA